MKSAVITGATGFIGLHLCEELRRNHIAVTALVRPQSPNADRLPKDVRIVDCDMDDYAQLMDVKADVFFHLAWEGATGEKRHDAMVQWANVRRCMEALQAAKRCDCVRFVSMGTVYERLTPQIMAEKVFRPADFYLLAKQAAHQMSDKLAEKLGLEFVWTLIFQPIGRYIRPEQMMAYAIKEMLEGNSPTFGPGKEPYDITAVEDIAYGLRLLGEKQLSKREYYVGSGQPQIMADYLKTAQKILDISVKLGFGERPDDGLRFSFDWYDIEPMRRDTGYKPRVSYDEAVRRTAAWVYGR